MSKILITGATGLVGRALGQVLSQQGHSLVVVSRKHPKQVQAELPFICEVISGDLGEGPISSPLLASIEGVIHLAGESVAGSRWTPSYKAKIYDSRIETTHNLLKSFKSISAPRLSFYIGASAIGYYGSEFDQTLTEESPVGQDFLAQVVQDWESAHQQWSTLSLNLKVTALRFGVIQSPSGGAFEKLLPLFKLGFGSALGTGHQWVSWVDLEDVVGVVTWLLQQESWSSVYNVVSPEPVKNHNWSELIAQALQTHVLPNVPEFILKLVLGEQASVILNSQKVLPQNLLTQGYAFKYPQLRLSLKSLQAKWGGYFYYQGEQFIPLPLENVFSFFSQAKNLEKISPPFLQFKVKSMSTQQIQKGTLIDYQLKVRGIPARWQSLITEWNPPHHFTDVQTQGPYGDWIHRHSFAAVPGGVLIKDEVKYNMPLGILGKWFGYHYVLREIRTIFDFRRKRIGDLLPEIQKANTVTKN